MQIRDEAGANAALRSIVRRDSLDLGAPQFIERYQS
jgi:hypothetical protein